VFERFTDRAREVLVAAQGEARELQHNFLGTEHLLLGLLQGEGVAARVLRSERLDLDEVRVAVRTWVGPGLHGLVDDAAALATIGIDLEQVTAAVEESFGKGALTRPIGP
jgi:ATP-dependent Clp protease ATP-binding subunit ClpA